MSTPPEKPIDRILGEEKDLLKQRRGEANVDDPHFGIGLSGGGIRSATFNLGILTVLEKKGMLKLADYLSTVSGGGYVGAYFLSTRMEGKDLRDDTATNKSLQHLRRFSNYLTPSVGALSADTWTMFMVWFRNTSMMQLFLVAVFALILLIPRLWGFLLAEALRWAWITDNSVLASIFIFHLVVVGIIYVLIDNFELEFNYFSKPPPPKPSIIRITRFVVLATTILAIVGCSLFAIGAFKPFADGGIRLEEVEWRFTLALGACGFYLSLFSLGFARGFRPEVGSVGLGLFALFFAVVSTLLCSAQHTLSDLGGWGMGLPNLPAAVLAVPLAAVLLFIGSKWIFRKEAQASGQDTLRAVLAGILCGVTAYGGIKLAGLLLSPSAVRAELVRNQTALVASQDFWNYALFASPGLLATLGCCLIVLLAISGRAMPDLVREGWSRFGALLYMKSTAMVVVGLIAIFGPYWLLYTLETGHTYIVASGGVVTVLLGVVSLFAANSQDTSGKANAAAGKSAGSSPKELLVKAAPFAFMLCLFVVVSMGLHAIFVTAALPSKENPTKVSIPAQALFQLDPLIGPHHSGQKPASVIAGMPFADPQSHVKGQWNGPDWPTRKDLTDFHWQFLDASIHSEGWLLWSLLAGLSVLAFILAGRLDVNEYSINRFYRNRIARCFIGAARTERRSPNTVTGFDGNDDLQMRQLREFLMQPAVHTDDTAAPYPMPIPIINTAMNAVGGDNAALQERRAKSFFFTPFSAYSEDTPNIDITQLSTGGKPGDVSLSSIVAISGAAANPNMGFHTSATISFLLTFFNIRLGWWVGIPERLNTFKKQFNLAYVFFELFGTADTDDAYVNLSDGGHFENLGLYELVHRRCPLILIGDGEQDANYNFESLGMAIRKCRIDFDAEIEIDLSAIRPKEPGGLNGRHWAIGKIHYKDHSTGYLLYLKSSFTGEEPYDVQQYRFQNPDFPQQSTGDQFFNESQFESYRQLGKHAAEELLQALNCRNCHTRKDWRDAAAYLYSMES